MSVFSKKNSIKQTLALQRATKKLLISSRNHYPILVYLFLSFFTISWFRGSSFISAGDFGWPIRFDYFFNFTKHIWDWSAAPGYNASRQVSSLFPYASYGYLALKIGIESAVFEKLMFFISFFFSGFGFYLFSSRYIKTKFGSFLAGLLYMMSPYASIVVWNPSYGLSFPFYCYVPLSLALLIDYCRDRGIISKKLFYVLLVTFFSFLGASYSNPVYFILYLFLASFFIFSNVSNRKLFFKKSLVFFIIYILLNAFWIIPLAFSIKTQYEGASNQVAGLGPDKNIQISNSVLLKDGFREMGFWTFNSGDAGDYYYRYRSVYNNIAYLSLSCVAITLTLFGLSQKNKKLQAIYLLFFMGLIVNSGLLFPSPFNIPFKFVFNLPLVDRMFRTVFTKTGIIISLSFPIIFLGTVEKYKNYYVKKYSFLLVIILILIRSIPFISGEVIMSAGNILPPQAFNIPTDYYQMADYINKLEDSRILTLPIPKSYNYIYKWGKDGYSGGNFFRSMINKSNFYTNNNPVIVEYAATFDPYLLGRLGVSYILVHKDIPLYFSSRFITRDFTKMYESITTSNDLELVKETENLSLYKVKSFDISDLIYVADDPIFKTNSDLDVNVFANLLPNQILVDESQSAPAKKIIIPQYRNQGYPRLEEWNDGWAWPNASVSPTSWLHMFVRVKEELSLIFTTNLQDKIEKHIWFSAKRVVEMNKYSLDERTTLRLNMYLKRNTSEIARLLGALAENTSGKDTADCLSLYNKAMRYTQRSLYLGSNYSEETNFILSSFYKSLQSVSKSYCQGRCWLFNADFTGEAVITGLNDLSSVDLFLVKDGKLQKLELRQDNSLYIKSGTEYAFIEKENTLDLLQLPVTTKSYFDGKTSYAYNLFSNIYEYKSNPNAKPTFKYKNPSIIEIDVEKVDPKNLYSLVINYSKDTAQVGVLLLEYVSDLEYVQNTAKIGDLNNLEKANNLNEIFMDDEITATKIKGTEPGEYIYLRDFELSPNSSAIKIVLFTYTGPDTSSSVQINSLLLRSVTKKTPLISNFKFETPLSTFKNIAYKKINDYGFSFTLETNTGYLVLNTSYDSGWILKSGKKELPHFVVDGYKNGWVLPNDTKKTSYILEYVPDKNFSVGIYISFTVLLMSILVFLRNIWKRR